MNWVEKIVFPQPAPPATSTELPVNRPPFSKGSTPGIPVAAVGLDRGDNAALLAIQILSLNNEKLQKEMLNYRKKMKEKVLSGK